MCSSEKTALNKAFLSKDVLIQYRFIQVSSTFQSYGGQQSRPLDNRSDSDRTSVKAADGVTR